MEFLEPSFWSKTTPNHILVHFHCLNLWNFCPFYGTSWLWKRGIISPPLQKLKPSHLDTPMSIYKVVLKENPDFVIYVGSSSNVNRRWNKEHLNPYYNHADFGRWLHENKMIDKVELVIVQKIQGDKKELLRNEFLWKIKLHPRFGILDGLKYQPVSVQMEIKRIQNNLRHANLYKNLDHEKIDAKNKRLREKNKSDRPRGPQKKRKFCPHRERMNAERRKKHADKLRAAGKIYRPRNTRSKKLALLAKPIITSPTTIHINPEPATLSIAPLQIVKL